MTPEILDIADTAQTFVDDSGLAGSSGFKRRFHPAKKISARPLLAQTLPCESQHLVPIRVLKIEPGGIYHMWYYCHHEDTGAASLHLATSSDGITWDKPALQSDGTNLCTWADGSPWRDTSCALFHDPDDPDPARRYKLLYYKPSYYLACSPDGTVWTPHSNEPVWPNGSGDGLEECFFFLPDKIDGKFRAYMRVWQQRHTLRALSLGESDDLTAWSGPSVIWQAGPEFGPGAQVYGMGVFIDQGVYWGLPWMFYTNEPLHPRDQQTIRLKLLTSRDGRQWQSVFPDQDSVPLGEPGAFDSEMILLNCPVVSIGDRNLIYYSGHACKHDGHCILDDNDPRRGGIGLAEFRSNGFVSLHADNEGVLLTRRFLFKGDQLQINAATSVTGSVVAELIADNGDLVEGFSYADSDPFCGDATNHTLTWRGYSDLSAFTGQYLMLRLRARQADLCAYRAAGDKKLFTEATGPLPVRCGHCATAPIIDGIHNDTAWQDFGNSGVAEDFVRFEKNAPPPVQTRVMVTRDDDHLYFAVDCEEPHTDRLVANHAENEKIFNFNEDDTIEIRLNAPSQGTFFNQLCVNAAGRRFQAWFSVEEGGSRLIDDLTWQAAVSQVPGHWYVEMAVPFTALNTTPPASGERWLMNIIRYRHAAGPEVSCWSCLFGHSHRNDLSGTLVFT